MTEPLPYWLVEVRKATDLLGGFKWSNRYFVRAANSTIALSNAQSIWTDAEQQFHHTFVYCYEVYANLVGDAPNTVGFTQAVPQGVQRGVYGAGGSTSILPPFNVVRVDFPVPGSRPSRKFYRPLLTEDDVQDGALTSSITAAILLGLDGILAFNFVVDEDGTQWAGTASIRGITSRRLGKYAQINVPPAPPQG